MCAPAWNTGCFDVHLQCASVDLLEFSIRLLTGWRAVKSYNLEVFEKHLHAFQPEPHDEVTLVPPGHRAPKLLSKRLDPTSWVMKPAAIKIM